MATKWAVSWNNRKRLTPCRCFNDEHIKEPYEISMAWDPERRSNFFSPPAHVCAVTCITEISSIVTLSNQYKLAIVWANISYLLWDQISPNASTYAKQVIIEYASFGTVYVGKVLFGEKDQRLIFGLFNITIPMAGYYWNIVCSDTQSK